MKWEKMTHENTSNSGITADFDLTLDVIVDIELYFDIIATQKNRTEMINDPAYSEEYKQVLLTRYSISLQALKDLFI